jgi:hypothetical protein
MASVTSGLLIFLLSREVGILDREKICQRKEGIADGSCKHPLLDHSGFMSSRPRPRYLVGPFAAFVWTGSGANCHRVICTNELLKTMITPPARPPRSGYRRSSAFDDPFIISGKRSRKKPQKIGSVTRCQRCAILAECGMKSESGISSQHQVAL